METILLPKAWKVRGGLLDSWVVVVLECLEAFRQEPIKVWYCHADECAKGRAEEWHSVPPVTACFAQQLWSGT